MAVTVRRELVLPLEPAEAWELVSDERHLEEWLAPGVRLDLRPGGDAVFTWEEGMVRRGVVEDVEAPRRLSFRWSEPGDGRPAEGKGAAPPAAGESRVEFEIEPVPEGSRVVVTETGIRTAPEQTGPVALARGLGWATVLGGLRVAAAERRQPMAVGARRQPVAGTRRQSMAAGASQPVAVGGSQRPVAAIAVRAHASRSRAR
jgi:uncharacterized protein YndB with AHSA1/START domain